LIKGDFKNLRKAYMNLIRIVDSGLSIQVDDGTVAITTEGIYYAGLGRKPVIPIDENFVLVETDSPSRAKGILEALNERVEEMAKKLELCVKALKVEEALS